MSRLPTKPSAVQDGVGYHGARNPGSRRTGRVSVRLTAGEELTGKITSVTKDLLYLSALAGRDYFDAVIDINKVEAVIVRTKE